MTISEFLARHIVPHHEMISVVEPTTVYFANVTELVQRRVLDVSVKRLVLGYQWQTAVTVAGYKIEWVGDVIGVDAVTNSGLLETRTSDEKETR